MSNVSLEAYLARLYTDDALREQFLAAPEHAARDAGLSAQDVDALVNIDRDGLQMAADSYAWKRKQHRQPKKTLGEWVFGWVRKKA